VRKNTILKLRGIDKMAETFSKPPAASDGKLKTSPSVPGKRFDQLRSDNGGGRRSTGIYRVWQSQGRRPRCCQIASCHDR